MNQIWALDFMHDTLYEGRKFRLLNVIDEGNREALRIESDSSIFSWRLLRVMGELIEFYGKPKVIQMDNGPEMPSAKFVSWAEQQGIKLRHIQPGKSNQNAFVQRFNHGIRRKCSMPGCSIRWRVCRGWLTPKSPLLNCLLDRGGHIRAP
ncbi:MAG: DDE-type integrase/transposase/recombinase [Leptolyngbyaceae bacterium]|nr:DDE-type integrase/transposase/recombinase [Leptolyngbyaceae bacterium]